MTRECPEVARNVRLHQHHAAALKIFGSHETVGLPRVVA